jgi:hypothetical protein
MSESAPTLHAVNGHQLAATRNCRTTGCEFEATGPTRGAYANLCDRCHEIAYNRRRSAANAPASGYEGKAKKLVSLGRDLDRALGKYTPVREEFRRAMEAWAKAVEALTD